MQTNFTSDQLADPGIAHAESILRKCVHCGFCTATCPTYVELGDELDSPRGRIYLIKEMLEGGKPATKETVKHIDRCLSCLSCMSTCPSGVNYMHLIDHARTHVDKTYQRPLADRLIRQTLMFVLPHPGRFKLALRAAKLGRPFAGMFEAIPGLKPLSAMLKMAPGSVAADTPTCSPGVFNAENARKGRVALLTGCAQPVLNPGINEATVELLTRLGIEVVVAKGVGCCGALTHHMGKEDDAQAKARANVDAWIGEMESDGLDAIIINTSGCGTTVKDYAHLLSQDDAHAEKAERVTAITKDISEYLSELDLEERSAPENVKVAYHAACSLQHGQQIKSAPKELLRNAGFNVVEPAEGHLCCGSAGTYNILQPEIAARLQKRKVRNIEATKPDIIAAGNIGCMTQIGLATGIPIVHTVELLNWAYGGPKPENLR
ncbi:MAG: glycolate oxidase subunit GlcF [Hyphomicrobiales bacterium]